MGSILSQCCDRDKYPFLYVHTDLLRSKKPPFPWISTLKGVFVNFRFCAFSLWGSVNGFKKTDLDLRLCTKTEQCERGIRNLPLVHSHGAVTFFTPASTKWGRLSLKSLQRRRVWHFPSFCATVLIISQCRKCFFLALYRYFQLILYWISPSSYLHTIS